jgi:hypothetical protein
MARFIALFGLILASRTLAFLAHGSLAGLTKEERDRIIPTLKRATPEPPPGPLNDTSAKLVNDPAHPWQPQQETDIRGPCPGLNTLASHGVSFVSAFGKGYPQFFRVSSQKWYCYTGSNS